MALRVPQARSAAEALQFLRAGIPLPPVPAPSKRKSQSKAKQESAADAFAAACADAGLQPVRELKFALEVGRKWAFDFAWPSVNVAVEIEGLVLRFTKKKRRDGTTYHLPEAGGRHATIDGFKEDCRKYATAAILGWMVLRFEQEMVRNGEALKFTQQLLHARGCGNCGGDGG